MSFFLALHDVERKEAGKQEREREKHKSGRFLGAIWDAKSERKKSLSRSLQVLGRRRNEVRKKVGKTKEERERKEEENREKGGQDRKTVGADPKTWERLERNTGEKRTKQSL